MILCVVYTSFILTQKKHYKLASQELQSLSDQSYKTLRNIESENLHTASSE